LGCDPETQTIADALVCVVSRRAALATLPAGSNDHTQPIRDGLITEGHVHAELGELIAGNVPGRTSPDHITRYQSVGVAVKDAAAAALVLAAARETCARHDLAL
jgi:alanine dehydrogenase